MRLLLLAGITLSLMTTSARSRPVFLSVEQAKALLSRGARVLDARGPKADAPFLPGAVVTSWTDVRDGMLRVGRLTEVGKARAHYAERGVHLDRPVLVYGSAHRGWGEEGRVWWDLSYLGHPEVYILDGGVGAWADAKMRTASVPSGPLPGAFAVSRTRPSLRATAEQVRGFEKSGGLVIDARTKEEFGGATPFLSSRGGHVPGARHLHWRDLLDAKGHLRPTAELQARLPVAEGEQAVYCTGGVRSAFVVAVMRHLGRPARNYDGSWWDWSAREDYPVHNVVQKEDHGR